MEGEGEGEGRLGVGGIMVPFPVHVMNRVQQLLTWGCGRYCTGGRGNFTKEM